MDITTKTMIKLETIHILIRVVTSRFILTNTGKITTIISITISTTIRITYSSSSTHTIIMAIIKE